MYLFNVSNTSNDTTCTGKSWIDALEETLGRPIPNKNGLVGAHMSMYSGMSGTVNTQYIAAIPQGINCEDNHTGCDVQYYAQYNIVRSK